MRPRSRRRRAVSSSRVVQALQSSLVRLRRDWADSRPRAVVARLLAAAWTARSVRALRPASADGRRWLGASLLATRAVPAVLAWTRSAAVVRWWTSPPAPRTVVVEFDRTLTVGPLARTLRLAVEAAGRSEATSALADVATTTRRWVQSAPVRALSAVVLGAVAAGFVLATVLGTATQSLSLVAVVTALLAVLGLRVDVSWARLGRSRPVEWVVSLLSPPSAEESDGEKLPPRR